MKPLKASIILVVALLLSSNILSNAYAKSYYKWVDDRGTTHYSERPPAKSVKNIKLVRTQGWINTAPVAPSATAVEPEVLNQTMPMAPQSAHPDGVVEKTTETPTPNKPAKMTPAPPTKPMRLAPENPNSAEQGPAL